MVGKFLLPPLGSTPSVWNTTVLFFQATLLAGYLFSHLTRRLHPVVQLAVIALGVVSLPIAVKANLAPSESHPVAWLLGLLALTAGLPFFALPARAPPPPPRPRCCRGSRSRSTCPLSSSPSRRAPTPSA